MQMEFSTCESYPATEDLFPFAKATVADSEFSFSDEEIQAKLDLAKEMALESGSLGLAKINWSNTKAHLGRNKGKYIIGTAVGATAITLAAIFLKGSADHQTKAEEIKATGDRVAAYKPCISPDLTKQYLADGLEMLELEKRYITEGVLIFRNFKSEVSRKVGILLSSL